MIFGWLRRRRRAKLLAEPFPGEWLPMLEALPFYAALDADERARLHPILRVIVAEKNWEGCGGLDLTDEIRVVIAAQAALLLLSIEHEYYRRVRTILVYPSAYTTGRARGGGSIVGEGSVNAGEAWYRGPVILSWDAARHGAIDPKDGRNLVFHEFAHKLDMMDGFVNGTPPLHRREDYRVWSRIMTEEFRALTEAAQKGRKTVLDRYGATNEAEFFRCPAATPNSTTCCGRTTGRIRWSACGGRPELRIRSRAPAFPARPIHPTSPLSVSSRRSFVHGFGRKASEPLDSASATPSASSTALISTSFMAESRSWPRISRTRSGPSISGMFRSMSATSAPPSLASRARASGPSAASVTA
jgi:Mlc titration factor MtfA (ptsG expression regulator)